MRALLDANVFISYLLSGTSNSPPVVVVDAAFTGRYTLLLTEQVIGEVIERTASKPYLAYRISRPETYRLVQNLRAVAEIVPELEEPLPEVGPDRKDDYLYAHALVGQADFLVSGDKGVRAVASIGGVKIVTPAEFLHVLQQTGHLTTSSENQ